jgi:hypothetical protein
MPIRVNPAALASRRLILSWQGALKGSGYREPAETGTVSISIFLDI